MLQPDVSLHSNTLVPAIYNVNFNKYPSWYLEFCIALGRRPCLRDLCCMSLCLKVFTVVCSVYVSQSDSVCGPDSSCHYDRLLTKLICLKGLMSSNES